MWRYRFRGRHGVSVEERFVRRFGVFLLMGEQSDRENYAPALRLGSLLSVLKAVDGMLPVVVYIAVGDGCEYQSVYSMNFFAERVTINAAFYAKEVKVKDLRRKIESKMETEAGVSTALAVNLQVCGIEKETPLSAQSALMMV